MTDSTDYDIVMNNSHYTKQRLDTIYHSAPMPVFSWNKDGKIIDLNQEAEELFGWNLKEIKNNDFISKIIAEDDRDIWKNYKKNRVASLPHDLMSRAVKKDGSIIYCSFNNALIKEDGSIKEILTIARDLEDYLKIEMEITRLVKAINETDNWVIITDEDGIIEYANTTVKEVTGYSQEELIGNDPSLFKSGKQKDDFYKDLWETVEAGEVFNDILINKKKNEELFFSEQTITPIKNENGEIINYISVGKDITQNEKMKEKIEYLSNYNAVFSLPNRKLIQRKIDDIVDRDASEKMAVVVLNIEKIKHLNEIYSAGQFEDTLINYLADTINSKADGKAESVKIDDENYLAYLGGNEFGLLLDNIGNLNEIYRIAEEILKFFSEPVEYKDNHLMMNLKIGISVYLDDCVNAEKLLANAEVALTNADRNSYAFFDSKMNEEIKEFNEKEARLNQALKNDEFIVHYQPYYRGVDKKLYGMEALIRWQLSEKELISPKEFIPILEESHLIKKAGLIVVKKVIKSLQNWLAQGYEVVPVSINLSAKQIEDSRHLHRIYKIIEKSGIEKSFIKFEITESLAMDDVDYSLKVMNEMKERGFRIAIDDFGTGYSSFSYLHKFPIDYLKIDISFIRNMTKSAEGKNIVEAIINLAHVLKLKTIAEGVETEIELKELNKLDNNYVQGYYFSCPLPEDKINGILNN